MFANGLCMALLRYGWFCELCAYALESAKMSKTCFRLFSDLKINKFMKTKPSNY